MKQRILVSILVCALCVSSTGAQFFPTVVYDPTNYANAVLRHAQLQAMTSWQIQSFWQAVYAVDQLRHQYNYMLFMARQMADKERYRAVLTPWRGSEAANVYGTTGPWTRAINRGVEVLQGYERAIEPLTEYGPVIAELPEEQLRRVMTRYGTVELADAANLHGIALLGTLRNNAEAVEQAIRFLESDSLSSRDEFNTQIAVLNKINAAGTIALRAGQDTNKLLVALLEQQITHSKRRRDAEAAAINAHVAFQQRASEIGLEGIRGTTQVLANFRLP
jgi:hypothetical protein